MNLAKIQAESNKRTKKLVDDAMKKEEADFNAKEHLSIKVMPYKDITMHFRQQERRVSWMRKGEKHCSARYYPSAECAKEIIDELVRLGAKNVSKDDDLSVRGQNQMSLF